MQLDTTAAPVGVDQAPSYWALLWENYMANPWRFVDPLVGMKAGMWGTPVRLARGQGQSAAPDKEQLELLRVFAGSPFGAPRPSAGPHMGSDIPLPIGTPVQSPTPAVVMTARPKDIGRPGGVGVILYYEVSNPAGLWRMRHGLWHMDRVTVIQDQQVALGQALGESGNTGSTTGPHLHWQTQIDFPRETRWVMPIGPLKGFSVNPWFYLNDYWVRLLLTRPGDHQFQNAWAYWLWSGNHEWAASYLTAADAPDGTVPDALARKGQAVARDVTATLQQGLDEVKNTVEGLADSIPWRWIGAGVVVLSLAYGGVTAYARGAGSGR